MAGYVHAGHFRVALFRVDGVGDTHVEARVTYKPNQGVVVNVDPVEVRNGIVSRKFTICGPATPERIAMPMTRLNRKKLAEVSAEVGAEVDARSGPTWDMIVALCKDKGYTLAEVFASA